MITDKMGDFNSNILLIISENFITRMRMTVVDLIFFKICKISAIKNWWEPQNPVKILTVRHQTSYFPDGSKVRILHNNKCEYHGQEGTAWQETSSCRNLDCRVYPLWKIVHMYDGGDKNKVYTFVTRLCKFRKITETSLPVGFYF